MKKMLFLIIALNTLFCFAQNDKPDREEFTLELPVDKVHFYTLDVAKSPYFVQPTLLQIYPGEKLNVQAEMKDGNIASMKVVKDNLHPERTITMSFEYEKQEDGGTYMMLVVNNPFDKPLHYEALMYTPKSNAWATTSILDVMPKIAGEETWPHPIVSLTLFNWKLK